MMDQVWSKERSREQQVQEGEGRIGVWASFFSEGKAYRRIEEIFQPTDSHHGVLAVEDLYQSSRAGKWHFLGYRHQITPHNVLAELLGE